MDNRHKHRAAPARRTPTPIDYDLSEFEAIEQDMIEIESITLTGEQVAVTTDLVADITVTGSYHAVRQQGRFRRGRCSRSRSG